MERQEGHTPLRYEPEKLYEGKSHIAGRSPGIFAGERKVAHAVRQLDARIKGGRDEEAEATARRLVACWNAFLGIPTAALEHLSSLPPKERFGALSDIAKLHEMKEE